MSAKVALLALVIAVASALIYEPRVGLSMDEQFAEYNVFWNKTHASPAERLARFQNFKLNAKKIADLNAKTQANGKGAHFGFTKFSDWSFEEFMSLNGFRPSKPLTLSNKRSAEQSAPTQAVDWVAKGMTTAVKDQGQCGSCWAFSVAETVESANLMAGMSVVPLAPQEIVDCASVGDCGGGDPQDAFGWVQNQGLDAESCYPYTGQDGNCASSKCTPSAKISNVIPINGVERSYYDALVQYGPLSICCDAEAWQNYNGGILTADQCGQSVNHAIQLTGYSPDQGGYWIVRNSWGANWGENGFIYLQYGQNTCALSSEITAATA